MNHLIRELPGGTAPLPGTPGRASGELIRPGAGPALPEPPPAGGAEGGTGLAPMGRSRSAAGGHESPRPPVRRTQASPVPAVPASGTGAREESPGAVRQPSGTSPAQDPAGDARAVAAPSAGTSPARGAAVRASAPLAGRTFTIELPAGLKLITQNQRLHWSERNRRAQALKKAAWAMTVNARIPRLGRVEILGIHEPPDRRRRDAENYAPSLKAAIDGIVAAGRLPDDDSGHVVRAWCEIGEVYPRGRLRVIIREVAAGDSGQPRGAA